VYPVSNRISIFCFTIVGVQGKSTPKTASKKNEYPASIIEFPDTVPVRFSISPCG